MFKDIQEIKNVKEYVCNVEVVFGGNNFEAGSKEEYIEKVKESFREEYGLDLADHEIKNIRLKVHDDYRRINK